MRATTDQQEALPGKNDHKSPAIVLNIILVPVLNANLIPSISAGTVAVASAMLKPSLTERARILLGDLVDSGIVVWEEEGEQHKENRGYEREEREHSK